MSEHVLLTEVQGWLDLLYRRGLNLQSDEGW